MVGLTQVLAKCADERILPKIFLKRNRHGVCYVAHLFSCAVAFFIVLLNISIDTAFAAFSLFDLICGIVLFIPPFVMEKKYPKCVAHAPFQMPKALSLFIGILGILVTIYLCVESAKELGVKMWIVFFAIIFICYAYFVARIVYLKKKENFDLLAEVRKPYAPWEEKEASFE